MRFDQSPKDLRNKVRPSKEARSLARQLRKDATPPEVVLWSRLRRKQLKGLRFRRQHPLGSFIADFYCHQARLVVEVDGRVHEGKQHAHDLQRDSWMRSHGLRVVRIPGTWIPNRIEDALAEILRVAESPE